MGGPIAWCIGEVGRDAGKKYVVPFCASSWYVDPVRSVTSPEYTT